jgi:hypothetical protein
MLGDHQMVGIPSKRKICQEAAGLFEPGISKRKRRVTPVTSIRSALAEAQAFQKNSREPRELQAKTAVALFFLGPRLASAYTFCRNSLSVR